MEKRNEKRNEKGNEKRRGTVGLVREAHNLKVGSSSLLVALFRVRLSFHFFFNTFTMGMSGN